MRTRRVKHFVYILKWGNEIVYVGCTKNLSRRLDGHRDKIFDCVGVLAFPDKASAMSAERRLLVIYMPRYNWIPEHILKKFGKLVVAVKEKILT